MKYKCISFYIFTDEDEEENKKHHSIFEVIVDEYVSMYDKVKARSNRACKNQPTPQQQKEEERKQQKLKEQFQQLKQSRYVGSYSRVVTYPLVVPLNVNGFSLQGKTGREKAFYVY